MKRFKIDGREYDVYVTDYKESFSVADTDKSKRSLSGYMYRDVVGTYYNYTLTIRRSPSCSNKEWDDLWDVLSAPIESHECTFFHGQVELTQQMYMTSGERHLMRTAGTGAGYNNTWGAITIDFIAMRPAKEAK